MTEPAALVSHLRRRRWLAIAVAWLISLTAWLAVLQRPPWTEATTLVGFDDAALGADPASAAQRVIGTLVQAEADPSATLRLRAWAPTSVEAQARLDEATAALEAHLERLVPDPEPDMVSSARLAADVARERRDRLASELAALPSRVPWQGAEPPPLPPGRAVEIEALEQRLRLLRDTRGVDDPAVRATQGALTALRQDPLAPSGRQTIVNPALAGARQALEAAEHELARREAVLGELRSGTHRPPNRLSRLASPRDLDLQHRLPPKTSRLLLAGVGIGLVGGVGAALAAGRISHSFERASELQRTYRVPVIGTIPDIPRVSTRSRRLLADMAFTVACAGLLAGGLALALAARGDPDLLLRCVGWLGLMDTGA